MNGYESSDDQQPVTWLRGYRVFATHLIVLVFVASMLVTTGVVFFHRSDLLGWLTFSSEQVLRGEIWRIFTYGLVNQPSLWFAIDMFMIAWFGRELERAFGRRAFFRLYGSLYFLSPLLLSLVGLWRPMELRGESGAFALFIAFAALYPDMPMLFNILAKWLAIVLVGIYSLMNLSDHNWVGLLILWSTTGFAFAFVRYEQGRFSLPALRFGSSKSAAPKLQVVPDLRNPKSASPKPARESSMEEVDALLDKIAASGISSLTAKERAILDRAREDLLKKESSRQ